MRRSPGTQKNINSLPSTALARGQYMSSSPNVSMRPSIGDTRSITMSRTGEIIQLLGTATTSSPFIAGATSVAPYSFLSLSTLALNFSKFRWIRMKVYYVPCAQNVSGTVSYSFQYDCADLTPASIFESSIAQGVVTQQYCATSPFSIQMDTKNLLRKYYLVTTAATANAMTTVDRNLYVPAVLSYSVSGGAGASSVTAGYLAVDYTIELADPIAAARNV